MSLSLCHCHCSTVSLCHFVTMSAAMSQTSQQELFKEYLDWAMDEKNVKAQDQL